jgi:hypothetical protein
MERIVGQDTTLFVRFLNDRIEQGEMKIDENKFMKIDENKFMAELEELIAEQDEESDSDENMD